MAHKVGNQENKIKKQYAYYPNGNKKAVVIHILDAGECPCKWEDNPQNYSDGNKIYRRL